MKYNNLNLVQTGTRPDGRPVYPGCIPTLSNTLLLTNTTEGSNYSITGKVDRPFSNGWFATGSYLYGDANTIQDGTNSTAFSTWANAYTINTSDPPLTRSNFSVGHRITHERIEDGGLWQGHRRTFSLYHNGQSGRPYVALFNGDVNGDSRTTNDLLYVPAREGEVIITNGTWADLDGFLSSDSSTEGLTRPDCRAECRSVTVGERARLPLRGEHRDPFAREDRSHDGRAEPAEPVRQEQWRGVLTPPSTTSSPSGSVAWTRRPARTVTTSRP